MEDYRRQVEEAALWIGKQVKAWPKVAVVAGTGMDGATLGLENAQELDYREIPYFPLSTVPGHRGVMSCGEIAGVPAMALGGRFHLYEGYTPLEITFPVRVMAQMGVRVLILANAVGGLNPEFIPGDIMLIADHINLTGENPLAGPNVDDWGPRFPEMHAAYDERLMARAERAAREMGAMLKKGIYAGLKGPSLETRAEMRFLRTIGADAVGFSTVNEVIVAVHAGVRVLGFATITNVNVPGSLTPASLDEILEVAGKAAPVIGEIIQKVIPDIAGL